MVQNNISNIPTYYRADRSHRGSEKRWNWRVKQANPFPLNKTQ